jgi:hypothetical protein
LEETEAQSKIQEIKRYEGIFKGNSRYYKTGGESIEK